MFAPKVLVALAATVCAVAALPLSNNVLTADSTNLAKTISNVLKPNTNLQFAAQKNTEAGCNCDENAVPKLWIDIVLAIDNSAIMSIGLDELKENLLESLDQIQVSQSDVHQSRVALVTYSGDAVVVGNLTTFQDASQLKKAIRKIKLRKERLVNVMGALQTSGQLFINSPLGEHQKVIVLVASAYNEGGFKDPRDAANQLKASGVRIVSIAFVQNQETGVVKKILDLASPTFGISNKKDNKYTPIPKPLKIALCQTNCFCKKQWQQYSDNFAKGGEVYGECVKMSSTQLEYEFASDACQDEGGYLASVFSEKKQNFLNAYYQWQNSVNGAPLGFDPYWIGLQYKKKKSAYVWQQGGDQTVGISPKDYDNWHKGFPNRTVGQCVEVSKKGFNLKWQNADCDNNNWNYFCQLPACTVDNYCYNGQDTTGTTDSTTSAAVTQPATNPPPPTDPPALTDPPPPVQTTRGRGLINDKTEPVDEPTVPTSSKCEPDWVYYNETDKCYSAIEQYDFPGTWQGNLDFCHSLKGDLVSIHSQRQNDWIYNTAFGFDNAWVLTLGLHNVNNRWEWTDGSRVDYINWDNTNPNPGDCGFAQIDQLSKSSVSTRWQKQYCSVNYVTVLCQKNAL